MDELNATNPSLQPLFGHNSQYCGHACLRWYINKLNLQEYERIDAKKAASEKHWRLMTVNMVLA